MAEKSPTKTKLVIAKNALVATFLAPRALMQAGEMLMKETISSGSVKAKQTVSTATSTTVNDLQKLTELMF